jgi:hypothetical protein
MSGYGPGSAVRELWLLRLSPVGVHFLLAMGLFPRPGLTGGTGVADSGTGWASPDRAVAEGAAGPASADGAAPLKMLFEVLAGPPSDIGAARIG